MGMSNMDTSRYYSDKLNLHAAVEEGDCSLVDKLLDEGADIEEENEYGDKPLHIAFAYGRDLDTVNNIIQNKNVSCSRAGLKKYVNLRRKDLVDRLLSRGASVNAKGSQEETPLHIAVRLNHITIVEKLLQKGAAVHERNFKGETPFDIAVNLCITQSFEKKVVKMLLDHGAELDVNKHYELLHSAVSFNMVSLIDYLLDKGVDVNLEDTLGRTALHVAVNFNNVILMDKLIDKGADVNALDSNGCSPLQASVRYGPTAVKLLLSKGADVNSINVYGETPLHVAIRTRANVNNVLILLSYGASLEIRNCAGQSPLTLMVNPFPSPVLINYIIPWRNHILKMYTAELTVLQSIAIDSVRKIGESVDHEQLEEEYRQELIVINNTTVGDYKLGILFLRCRKPYYMCNKDLVTSIQELLDSPRLSQMFPNYSVILEFTFSKSRKDYNLFYAATRSLINLSIPNAVLPTEIAFKIVELLDHSAQCQLVKSGLCSVLSNLPPDWSHQLPDSVRRAPVGHFLSDCELQQLLRSMERTSTD